MISIIFQMKIKLEFNRMGILQSLKALNKKVKINNNFKKKKTLKMILLILKNYRETKVYIIKIQDYI